MGRFKITAEKGTEGVRDLFDPPERLTAENAGELAETDEEWKKRTDHYESVRAVRIRFQYLANDRVDYWEDRAQAIALEERERVISLREKNSEEKWPQLHRPSFQSSEKRTADKEYSTEYLKEAGAQIEGVDLNDRKSEDLNIDNTIDLLFRMRWHVRAVMTIQRAQVPTAEQFLS